MSVASKEGLHGINTEAPQPLPQEPQAPDAWEGYGVYPMAPELPPAPEGSRWQLMQKMYTDGNGLTYPVFAFQLVPDPQPIQAAKGETEIKK